MNYFNVMMCVDFERQREKFLERLNKLSEKVGTKNIAVRGTSGVLAAGFLLAHGYKPFIIRKLEAKSHSGSLIEYDNEFRGPSISKYIFVDDFICSGNTLNQVIKKMAMNLQSYPVGICLYQREVNDKDLALLEKYSKRARIKK